VIIDPDLTYIHAATIQFFDLTTSNSFDHYMHLLQILQPNFNMGGLAG